MCCRGKCSKPNPASQSSNPAAVARPARDSPATRSLKCFEIGQDCQNITFDSSRLCPSDYTGLRPIPGLCTMFAECYKVPSLLSWRDCVSVQGRAYVKECPPGTQFCTIGNICDFPSKVEKTFSTHIPRLRATNCWCLMFPPTGQWQTSHNPRVAIPGVEVEENPKTELRLNTISPPLLSSSQKRWLEKQ